jgi:hypothetical protein
MRPVRRSQADHDRSTPTEVELHSGPMDGTRLLLDVIYEDGEFLVLEASYLTGTRITRDEALKKARVAPGEETE